MQLLINEANLLAPEFPVIREGFVTTEGVAESPAYAISTVTREQNERCRSDAGRVGYVSYTHIDTLDTMLRELHESMTPGKYEGVGKGDDLAFMPLLKKHERSIPFLELPHTINATHREGYGT